MEKIQTGPHRPDVIPLETDDLPRRRRAIVFHGFRGKHFLELHRPTIDSKDSHLTGTLRIRFHIFSI